MRSKFTYRLKGQTVRSARWAAFAVAIVHAVPVRASEAAEILGLWEQVTTNAGACRTCTIEFRSEGSGLSVTANNGWSASLSDPTGRDIVGAGCWANRGHSWVSGKSFTARFHRNGDHLEMTMIVDAGTEPKPVVRGTYRRVWQGV